MCAAAVLAVILAPLFGGAFGYARYGAAGGWIGALTGAVAAMILAGGPFALLANTERRRRAAERAAHPDDAIGG
jgi:hypothetical protein